MGYGSGRLPIERASKLGHMQLIEHEHVQRLLRQFQALEPRDGTAVGARSGHLDLSTPPSLDYVLTVDGGQALIPNELRRDKRMAFIKIGAMVIRREDVEALRARPVIDPRDLKAMFEGGTWTTSAALPLAGISLPGETVKSTIRKTVDAVLEYTKLYEVLNYLVSRQWDPAYEMDPSRNSDAPHMACLECGQQFYLPKSAINFECSYCHESHRLSDYLGIGEESPDDWSREEAAMALRNSLETLTLFHFIIRTWQRTPALLSRTLFLKDGPLLLRAQLSRLVEPLRALIERIHADEQPLHIVGIEKNGELVEHIEEIKKHLPEIGDYFLPSVQYLYEEIGGRVFNPRTFRDRVRYGAKLVVRIGPNHVIPMDIPTVGVQLTPQINDLLGVLESARLLSAMTSYAHDNALIPIKLANSLSSISERPSGDILRAFAGQLFNS